jgi:hypothetical protein
MSEFYSEEPIEHPSELPVLVDGEVRGHAWSAKPIGDEYVLSFLSGELAGREKAVVISKAEYLGLADGSQSIDIVLNKHGAR